MGGESKPRGQSSMSKQVDSIVFLVMFYLILFEIRVQCIYESIKQIFIILVRCMTLDWHWGGVRRSAQVNEAWTLPLAYLLW